MTPTAKPSELVRGTRRMSRTGRSRWRRPVAVVLVADGLTIGHDRLSWVDPARQQTATSGRTDQREYEEHLANFLERTLR